MSNEDVDVVIAVRKDSVASSAAAGGDGSVDIISSTAALFHDALEDVHTRFVLNLPESELQTADRIFFQLEQAWYVSSLFEPKGALRRLLKPNLRIA